MIFFFIIFLFNLYSIFSYQYTENDKKLFENYKNYHKININDDINYKNLNYFIDKKYNCILFYYKYIQNLQTRNDDILYFQDYYNYWKPNSFEKVCIHMIKIYNDYIIKMTNQTIDYNNKNDKINIKINSDYKINDDKINNGINNDMYSFKYNHKYLRTNNK